MELARVPETCRKCGRPGVTDPEAADWGDGGSLCPECRAERNARARGVATRIAAYATADILEQRGWRDLATIRSLPEMIVLRSIPFAGSGLDEQLPDTWAELGAGSYLLTVGDGRAVRNFVVDVDGTDITHTELSPAEVHRLPALLAALE